MKTTASTACSRRQWLALCCALTGCAAAVDAPSPVAAVTPPPGEVALTLWRRVNGGFVGAPEPLPLGPSRAGGGPRVSLLAPTAVALHDQELVVADSGSRRLWRCDPLLNTLVPVPDVQVTPTTALVLAPDLSLWVQDGAGGPVRRFARDGRVVQSVSPAGDLVAPAGLAVADLGATLLVADAGLRQWTEWRLAGRPLPVNPRLDGGASVGVDGIAAAGAHVWVLDRAAGLVHRVDRSGRVLARLGEGQLRQPVALAADRAGRVWVLERQDHSIRLLREGRPMQVFDAAALGVREPAAMAATDGALAVADRLGGQVLVMRVTEGRP